MFLFLIIGVLLYDDPRLADAGCICTSADNHAFAVCQS